MDSLVNPRVGSREGFGRRGLALSQPAMSNPSQVGIGGQSEWRRTAAAGGVLRGWGVFLQEKLCQVFIRIVLDV